MIDERMTRAERDTYWSGRWMVPVDHDHVGSLVFTRTTATCGECGAEWRAGEHGWVCVESGVKP